jgi:hypothetical protein
MYSCTLCLTSALDEVGSQRHAPTALPPGKTWYPLCRRLGGPHGQSGRMRKISPPPGFDPRTVQPVVIRYIYCVIPAHSWHIITPISILEKIYCKSITKISCLQLCRKRTTVSYENHTRRLTSCCGKDGEILIIVGGRSTCFEDWKRV